MKQLISLCCVVILVGCGEQAEQPIDQLAGFDPQAAYDANCAHCHDGSVPKAPHLIHFSMMAATTIADAMAIGVMKEQAAMLSTEEQRALAGHLAGADLASRPVVACEHSTLERTSPALQGWSFNTNGTRFIPDDVAQLRAADVPKLRLKWAFAYPGATRARSQPLPYGDAILVGSQGGVVYALDMQTGCAVWRFEAEAEVRNAVTVSDDGSRAYFGDMRGRVYAVDPTNGRELWRAQADSHPDVTLTGSPRLVGDTLYIPLSSKEWATAADPGYGCCTFRGGVAALAATDGAHKWTAYSIEEAPAPRGQQNDTGAELHHPAGAPIWNTPTVDTKRGLLYVGTGEAYTSPAADTSDAVLAFDLKTGARRWAFQATAGDAWNMACFIGGGPNCPVEDGPDMDIGAPPMILGDLVIAGQKSGDVYALNADTGEQVWHNKLGRGGFAGGVHWGMAADNERLYIPIADTVFTGRFTGERKPGLSAITPSSGEVLWSVAAPDVCAEEDKPACDPGYSAAVTATSDAVFAGAFDGHLRAYAATDGALLWDFNTNQAFPSVSGDVAQGGSIESDGPLIYQGHVLVNSGYLFGDRMPGNALLVFGVP